MIERLESAGIEIYGTDVNGTVTVITEGNDFTAKTEATGSPAPDNAGESRDPQPDPGPQPEPGPEDCVDINTASSQELERIIHIGPERRMSRPSLNFDGGPD